MNKHDLCWYCGCHTVVIDYNLPRRRIVHNMRTRDHVTPRVVGGRTVVTACFQCNQRKGSMTIEEFRQLFFGNGTDRFFGEREGIEPVKYPSSVPAPSHYQPDPKPQNFALAEALRRFMEDSG